jgi:hypothetical protein
LVSNSTKTLSVGCYATDQLVAMQLISHRATARRGGAQLVFNTKKNNGN